MCFFLSVIGLTLIFLVTLRQKFHSLSGKEPIHQVPLLVHLLHRTVQHYSDNALYWDPTVCLKGEILHCCKWSSVGPAWAHLPMGQLNSVENGILMIFIIFIRIKAMSQWWPPIITLLSHFGFGEPDFFYQEQWKKLLIAWLPIKESLSNIFQRYYFSPSLILFIFWERGRQVFVHFAEKEQTMARTTVNVFIRT